MDLLSMLMNARVNDVDGYRVGEVIGIHLAMGKLSLTIDIEVDEEDDPDGGEKDDIPEDDVSKPGFLKVVSLGKKVEING